MFALHISARARVQAIVAVMPPGGSPLADTKCCRSPTVLMTGPVAKKVTRVLRRQLKKLASRIDKVTQADARFFERFPDQQHRVRVAARADRSIAAAQTRCAKVERAMLPAKVLR
jgi:hypothetical protein